jgi:hypothetical protein
MKILSTIPQCTRLWEVKAIKTPTLIRVSLNRETQAKDGILDVLPEVLPFILYILTNVVIYMNSIKNTASSGTPLSFRYLIKVLGIELDLSEFSPLSKSVSGKSIPSLLSELHSHRSRKPAKPLLPPKDLGIELVNDFFATINLLCPLIHRPSFYREVNPSKLN